MHPLPNEVLRLSDYDPGVLAILLGRYGLVMEQVPHHCAIEGSYWGDEEAGLVGRRLLMRRDTPVHSILHETCHFICMDVQRRNLLHTDASGDYDEENAVCYLQILLADNLPGIGRDRMFLDMDAWGYTFRLGSARLWFEQDAQDAMQWLINKEILDSTGQPTYQLRIS